MANTQDTSSGKTSPEHFPPTVEKISAVSSKPSVRSKTAAFQFLDLRENGQKPERFWQNPIPSHGEFLMHNTGVHEPCRPPLSAKADISPTPWGNLPQRRKRIFLVADFDGASAGKILFESEGDSPQCGEMSRSDRGDGTVRVSGYSTESLRAWQRTAGSAADRSPSSALCTGKSSC